MLIKVLARFLHPHSPNRLPSRSTCRSIGVISCSRSTAEASLTPAWQQGKNMTSPQGLLSLSQQNRTTLSEPELDSAVLSNAYGAGPSLSQESSELFSFFPVPSHRPDYIFKTTNWALASFSLIKKYVVDIPPPSFSSMCLTYSLLKCASEFFSLYEHMPKCCMSNWEKKARVLLTRHAYFQTQAKFEFNMCHSIPEMVLADKTCNGIFILCLTSIASLNPAFNPNFSQSVWILVPDAYSVKQHCTMQHLPH